MYLHTYVHVCAFIYVYQYACVCIRGSRRNASAPQKTKQDQQNWIRGKFEKPKKFHYDEKATMRLLDRLIYAVEFESFLATKYNTTKRFGLEVCLCVCMHIYADVRLYMLMYTYIHI